MKILIVHNRYRQFGGEDAVMRDEESLLRSKGHEVQTLEASNEDIPTSQTVFSRAALAARTIWSRTGAQKVAEAISTFQPSVCHIHNFFPLLSPAIHHTAAHAGTRVVQTLHNYRLLCANGLFLRDERPCEECLTRGSPLPAIRHACYRDSTLASATLAAMQLTHRALGTWEKCVDTFIALTDFARSKFLEGGLPASKIAVIPNFLTATPQPGSGAGDYVLFVGRLAHEKGVHVLLDAWSRVGMGKLVVIGDGPLAPRLQANVPGIQFLGPRSHTEILKWMGEARALVVPSLWYEGLPKVVIESYAVGTPIVASSLGSLASLVTDGLTGLLVPPASPDSLATALRRAFTDAGTFLAMRQAAHSEFLARYTADRHYSMLLSVYRGKDSGAAVSAEGHHI